MPNFFKNLLIPWQRFSRNIVVLGFVSFFNDVSSESVARILPLFLRETARASFSAIGWVEGVADSLSVLLKLASGWISDGMRGKKLFLSLGYGLSALTRPFFPAAVALFGWGGALALKALDRVGKAVRTAPRDALIALESGENGKGAAFGLNRALDTLGAFFGVVLAAFMLWHGGGRLSSASFRSVIFAASAFGFVAVALVLWGVREKPRIRDGLIGGKLVWKGSWRGLTRPFYLYLACVGLFTLSGSSDAFLILKLRDAGFSLPATLALIAAYNALAALAAYPISRRSDESMNRKKPILIGWCIYAGAYALFGFAESPLLLGAGFIGYGLYYGFVESTEKALIADLVPSTHLGRAYGLFGFTTGALLLPANLLFGFLSDRFGMGTAFVTASGLALAAVLMLAGFKAPAGLSRQAV